jgi:predicted dehydrogenase
VVSIVLRLGFGIDTHHSSSDTMADEMFRVGVVGRGFGGYGLVPAFRRDTRCVISAICGTEIGLAKETAERLAIPAAYGSWAQMLADEELDAIAVAAPPEVQPGILESAMSAGLAVFAEKPLSTSAEQAEDLVSAAGSSGLANVIDFIFPELETWKNAGELIESGAIGEIELVVVDWTLESYDIARNVDSWKTAGELGGGALSHFGSHVCYYLEKYLGPISTASARLSKPPRVTGSGNSVALINFEFKTGALGSVTLSTSASYNPGHRVVFHGERGAITLENPTNQPVSGFKLFMQGRGDRQRREILDENVAPTTRELDDRVPAVSNLASRFIDWATGGEDTSPRFEHGLRVQRIVDACRQSDRSGRVVSLVNHE